MTAATTELHARIAGRSENLDLAELDLSSNATDSDILAALGRRHDLALTDGYVVVREEQAIIVRPVAFYG